MAIRLEKTFKVPRKELLEWRASYNTAQAKNQNVPAETRAYVPPFLAIKANQIENWIDHNIPARTPLTGFFACCPFDRLCSHKS